MLLNPGRWPGLSDDAPLALRRAQGAWNSAVLFVSFDRWRKAAKESVRLVPRTRSEKELVRTSTATAVAERQSPKFLDHDRFLIDAFQKAAEFAIQPERHDGAVPEIPNEQLASMLTE